MGFFKKLGNLLGGRGFKEDEEIEERKIVLGEEEQEKEVKEEQTEDPLQIYKTEEELKAEGISEEQELKPEEEFEEVKEEDEEKEGELSKAEEEAKEEIKEIQKKSRGTRSISSITSTIQEGTTSSVKINISPEMDIGDTYNQLLRNGVINIRDKNGNIDESLVQIIIENRVKLQHRFSAEIIIETTSGNKGMISIDGILAEQLHEIYQFIQVGATYTSQELKSAMDSALIHFQKQHGAIGGSKNPPPEKTTTIASMEAKVTFA